MRKTKCITLLTAAILLAAPATASASWVIEGEELTGSAALATTAKVTEPASLTASGVTVECDGSTLNGVSPDISAPNKLAASSLIFKECQSVTSSCTIAKAEIGTVPVVAELTEQTAPEDIIAFTPKTGTIFATIKYQGEECALLGVKPVKGKMRAMLPTGEEEEGEQELIADTGSAELEVGSASAIFKGKARFALASAEEFALLARPSRQFRLKTSISGTRVKLTIENITNANATVNMLTASENPVVGEWEVEEPAKATCKKLYAKKGALGDECSFNVQYRNRGARATETVRLEDENGGEIRKGVTCENANC
ncbi:MAG TPA: hypothetical protein VMU32_03145 [Solirubrobacteraceae bacterium]|nr:hypothetical protein [Solirubrobacteraceae bacterium]